MTRPVKKSESLEIRIPHAAKAAFMDRCRAEGTSASEALRGYIDRRLAEPEGKPSRVWLRVGAGAVAAFGLAGAALPSLAGPLERAGFERLDANRDGALSPAELGRLDRDGDGKVSFAEYRRR